MSDHPTRRVLTSLGTMTSRPTAFFAVLAYGVLWIAFEPETFNWGGIATLSVWTMTLFIQRAAHRDTQALHAKLDELLHAQSEARNSLTRIDENEPEDIERHRAAERAND
jgi:low affinity Fe/Cu permease